MEAKLSVEDADAEPAVTAIDAIAASQLSAYRANTVASEGLCR
jgi:hypothetical protein